jgi:thioredoxin reductase
VSAGNVDVAIVGAGPYGLSVAAHLNKYRVPYRIFGTPMHSWRSMMPKGMSLKSEGFASYLYDPDDAFTLAHYCKEIKQPYAHFGIPVPLATFAAYGLEFQRRFVPNVETVNIASVEPASAGGFELTTETGEKVGANRVVVAAGITHFGHIPKPLSDLPPELVTHSSRHSDLSAVRGRKVAVVGAGSSAVDLAALMHQAGAIVELIGRRKELVFHSPPSEPSLVERLKEPRSLLGRGWRLVAAAEFPQVFHSMPVDFRLRVVRTHLGPSTGWFVREMVEGKFPVHLGTTVEAAEAHGNEVHLKIGQNGSSRTIVAEHVVAGTGYRMSLRRFKFLGEDLLARIDAVEETPTLSRSFESSVPGLYFVGTISANQFGPLTRFVCGAKFTSRTLSKHLAAVRN